MDLSIANLYEEYKNFSQKIADLNYSAAVLQWDQETYLPPKGADIRGRQVATLTEMAHEMFTSVNFGTLLQRLTDRKELNEIQKRNIELSWEDYQKRKKFPSEFVRRMAVTTQQSFHSWIKARKENDFKFFKTDLQKILVLKKEEAFLLGFENHPYDALLDDHDKGSNQQLLDNLFDGLRGPLGNILDKISSKAQVEDGFLRLFFPKSKQWDFGMQLIKDLNYDLEAGRQDIAEHPFTINFNSNDVRITTRIDEQDLSNMIWSCIHEAGHALYEQGLPPDQYGLPLGEPASFSVHESQSRLWENHVGRSFKFCEHYFPILQEIFPNQLGGIQAFDFYKAINKVQSSLIRTEADELTYHFHVMIRYEIEKKLIHGDIDVNDVPSYWNEHYSKYLGVSPTDDKTGCLQDVHWSHGSFGYFPTYSQGSLLAAQFYAQAQKEIPNLEKETISVDYQRLLNWLRQHIHQFGRYYSSEDLCKKVTGEALNTRFFIEYLLAKYSIIYQF